MMIFSLVAMIGLEKCCITSACLQWLCHSGERTVARGPLVFCVLSCYCLIVESDGSSLALLSPSWGGESWLLCFVFNWFITCAVGRSSFTLPLGVVGRGGSRMISERVDLIKLPHLFYVFGQTDFSKQC